MVTTLSALRLSTAFSYDLDLEIALYIPESISILKNTPHRAPHRDSNFSHQPLRLRQCYASIINMPVGPISLDR
jgi:hypothetical protein